MTLSFKEYRKNKANMDFVPLSSDSRQFRGNHIFLPFFDSGFAEQRGKNSYIDEAFISHPIHKSDDVRPLNLSDEHKQAIEHYTSTPSDSEHGYASSVNINIHLMNRGGYTENHIIGDHSPEKVQEASDKLASAFTPENTNKIDVTTYASISPELSKKIENMKSGYSYVHPAFSSTSTSQNVASNFADRQHAFNPKYPRVDHYIKYTVNPGMGISTVDHTDYPENEILVNRGSRLQYSRTEEGIVNKIPSKVHHVTVLQHSIPMSEYFEYKDNSVKI
jgi:hypothetical protein